MVCTVLSQCSWTELQAPLKHRAQWTTQGPHVEVMEFGGRLAGVIRCSTEKGGEEVF